MPMQQGPRVLGSLRNMSDVSGRRVRAVSGSDTPHAFGKVGRTPARDIRERAVLLRSCSTHGGIVLGSSPHAFALIVGRTRAMSRESSTVRKKPGRHASAIRSTRCRRPDALKRP